ncbi:hypothetical protein Tco_0620181 [Tanacetum coccineum]
MVKRLTFKRFSENVGDSVNGQHFFDKDMSFLDIITKNVVTNFDVFSSRVLHWVFVKQKHILFPELSFFFLPLLTLLRIPSFLEGFVMSELSHDAIGVYHHVFDFSGVRIPFSSFLLALIKHYKIKPTVTLFWVFQTLCKQGDWFSFAKLHALHLSSAIDDPKPAASSYSMDDVRWLSAHVVKLRDMPDGCCHGSTLQRLPFYCTPPAVANAVIPDPTPDDLVAINPSVKVVAKAEASQNRNASTSGATSSHVANRTRSAMAQSSVTSIHSAAMIPSSGNQGGGSAAPAAEGPNTQDSWGKGIMTDADVASSASASRPRASSGPTSSLRDVSGDAIHRDFFPFSPGPYYVTYLEGGITENYHFPTPGEMVRIEALSPDQLTVKMSVPHCLMMSHGGELLARYHGLLKSHREYVKSTNSRLKSYQKKFASLNELESPVSLGTETSDWLWSQKFLASMILSGFRLTYISLAAVLDRLAEAFPLPEKLARPANVPTLRDTRISPPLVKESTVTHLFESLEFPSDVVPASSTAALEPNKEWVNAMADGPDHEMTDGTANAKPGSERVSSGPSDVVVALSAREKGDGFMPCSVVDEEVAATPFERILNHATRPKPDGFPPGTFSIAGQALVGSMGLLSLPGAKIVLSRLALELAWLLAR